MEDLYKKNKILFFVIILLVGFGLFFRLELNFNTPYMDEYNYLFVGKNLLEGTYWNTKSYIFSSDLPFYILGLGDYFYGIAGARLINEFLALISLFLFYKATKLIYSKEVALLASLLLFIQANFIFIGKFATYDTIALLFFNLFIFFMAKIFTTKQENNLNYLYASSSLVLAILCKYIVIIYLPFFVLFLLYKKDSKKILLSLVPIITLALYFFYYKIEILELYHNQVLSVHLKNASTLNILKEIIYYSYDKLLFAIFLIYKRENISSKNTFSLYLFYASLIMVFYHLISSDYISLYKHINYFFIFVIPIIAEKLYFLLNYSSRKDYLVVNTLLVIAMLFSLNTILKIESSYPNTSKIRPIIDSISDKALILSEDPYLFRYSLFNKLDPLNIVELNFTSEETLLKQIKNNKFDYIYLNGLVNPELSKKVRAIINRKVYKLELSEAYLLSKVVSTIDSGSIELYKKK